MVRWWIRPAAAGSDNRARMWVALGVNAVLLVAGVFGAIAFDSVALLADAGHVLSDVGAIAIGLFALALWQIVQAFLERNPDTKKKWGYRAKYVGTALAYIGIGVSALVYALGGQQDSSQSSQTFTAQLLATPGGVFLIVWTPQQGHVSVVLQPES